MTAPTVVTLSLQNENAATAVGGSGTVQIQLIIPISGQDGKVYTMSAPQPYAVVDGEFVIPPSLVSTDGSLSLYKFIVSLDDWSEVFMAPVPAAATTLAAVRALATTAAGNPAGGPFVPLALVGAPNGLARLGGDGLLLLDERPPSGDAAHVYASHAEPLDENTLQELGATGDLVLEAGQVIEGKIIDVTRVLMPNNGSELRNCKIICNDVNAIHVDANTGLETGRRIVGCEIINPGGRAIGGAGFTVENTYGHKLGDDFILLGRSHASPTVIRGCRADSFRPLDAAHFDGVQFVTLPAAPVIIDDCDFFMNLDAGFAEPADAGSTGAIFAAADVAIGPDDPNPARRGRVYISNSRFQSTTGDYSVSIADNFSGIVTIENCAIGAGITATENIAAGTVVYGNDNTDLAGNPLVTSIGGSDLGDYLLVDDPRQAGGGSGPEALDDLTDVNTTEAVNGQFLGRVAGVWQGVDAPTGGGAEPGAVPSFYSTGMFNGTFGPAGSGIAPDFTPDTQPGPSFLLTIPGTDVQVGNLVHWEFRFISTGGDAQLDVASIVAGVPVNYYSDDYGPNQNPVGAGDLYQSGDFGHVQPIAVDWVVQETDLDASDGNSFTLSLLYAQGGTRNFGLANQTGKVTATNLH